MNDQTNNATPNQDDNTATPPQATNKVNRHRLVSATEFAGAYYDVMYKETIDGSEYTHRFPEYKNQAKAVFVTQYVINSEKDFSEDLRSEIHEKFDDALTESVKNDEDRSRDSLVEMLAQGVEAAAIELKAPVPTAAIDDAVQIIILQQAPEPQPTIGDMHIRFSHEMPDSAALAATEAHARRMTEFAAERNAHDAERNARNSWFKPYMAFVATAALGTLMYVAYQMNAHQDQNNQNAKNIKTAIDSTDNHRHLDDSTNRNIADRAAYHIGSQIADQVARSSRRVVAHLDSIKENMHPEQVDTSAIKNSLTP